MRLEKPICAQPRFSDVFPSVAFVNSLAPSLWYINDDGNDHDTMKVMAVLLGGDDDGGGEYLSLIHI